MRTSILTLSLALTLVGCAEGELTLRSSGEACASSDECASTLCYESLCFEPSADEDGDGLTNALEAELGTQATRSDSDGDGLSDGEEVAGRYDAPPDADGDSVIDALESARVVSALEDASETDEDCIAPQFDPSDGTSELLCCCGGDCAKQGVTVLTSRCEPEGGLSCTFAAELDLDGDGLLAACDDDDDGDGALDAEDCEPSDPAVYPGAMERCDGLDNDCDDGVDEAWQALLAIPCLTAHTDCGGAANFICAEGGDDVVCPIEPAPEGTLCDDGNPQTEGDRCDAAGNCAGLLCQAEAECVSAQVEEGVCVSAVESGFCFIDGTCVEGGEVHASFPCKRCDPESSDTAWTLSEGGTACDDGDPMTLADSCTLEGQCVGTLCDGGGACTTPTVEAEGCVYTPVAGSCFIEGVCYSAGAVKPGWPCKRCDPGLSQGGWTTTDPGGSCDDGDQCTVGEVCTAAATCEGQALECADAIACTLDSCAPESGCQHVPQDGPCDDGVSCTQDACVAEAGCVNTPLDGACDEGDPCWSGSCDVLVGCVSAFTGAEGCLFPCEISESVVGASSAADGATTGHAVFAGDVAYVLQQSASQKELSVIDISDPSAPAPLELYSVVSNSWGESIDLLNVSLPRRGLILDAAGPLFISSSGGFHVTDITDPSDPHVIANGGETLGQLYGMTEHPSAPVIYGAIESGYVVRFDIQTLTNPKAAMTDASVGVETFDVAVGSGNRLFLAGYDLSLHVFDITNPLEPIFTQSVEGIAEATNFAESVVAISQELAVVASNRDGYRLVDISSPYQMIVSFEAQSPSRIHDLAFFEGYLILAAQDEGLVILDIANPSAPTQVATIPLSGTPRGVHVVGHRVFVSTSSTLLKVIDLTLPCVDGDLCTLDACHVNAGCVFEVATPCDDLDPCTTDSCSPAGGCQHQEILGCALGGLGAP